MSSKETTTMKIMRLEAENQRLKQENTALKAKQSSKKVPWQVMAHVDASKENNLSEAERDRIADGQIQDQGDVREDGYDWIASNNSLVATFWVNGEFQQYDCLILRQRTIQEE